MYLGLQPPGISIRFPDRFGLDKGRRQLRSMTDRLFRDPGDGRLQVSNMSLSIEEV